MNNSCVYFKFVSNKFYVFPVNFNWYNKNIEFLIKIEKANFYLIKFRPSEIGKQF